MDKSELKKILADHEKWVDTAGQEGTRADLRDADLRGADLRDADLRGADLRRADLHDADLRRADLRRADLRDADLRRADLRRADLHGANLRRADLRRADLHGADLRGADLSWADMHGADMDYSSWPLWCGSLKAKIDKRLACQLLYHTLCAMQSVDDEECRAVCNDPKVIALANQFHRAEECGKINIE